MMKFKVISHVIVLKETPNSFENVKNNRGANCATKAWEAAPKRQAATVFL